MPWLTHDFDSREPKNDLQDIDTGKYLHALATLPQSVRSLLQDNDLRCEVDEIDGSWKVVKIVKKREAEFLQGTDKYFVYDDEGNRIPLSEEEYDAHLGIIHNPNDIYNCEDVSLESLEQVHMCPRDVWDVVFDATEYVREARRLIALHKEGAYKLGKGELEWLASELIYSADFFKYHAYHAPLGTRAQKVAKRIEAGMTKQELGAAIAPPKKDQRLEQATKLEEQAAKLRPCKQRATLMLRAQKMRECSMRDRMAGKFVDNFSRSERNKLWAMWREREMEVNGTVELKSWQFRTAYSAKLSRQVHQGLLTTEEADQKLSERMEALYGQTGKLSTKAAPALPQWLRDAPPVEAEGEEEIEFTGGDWLDDVPLPSEDFFSGDTALTDGEEHLFLELQEA